MSSLLHILLISHLIYRSSNHICDIQNIRISDSLFSDIFNSDAIAFIDVDRISCVYHCSIYDEDILITSAVYVKEDRLCSCTHVPTVNNGAEGIWVDVIVLNRPGKYDSLKCKAVKINCRKSY